MQYSLAGEYDEPAEIPARSVHPSQRTTSYYLVKVPVTEAMTSLHQGVIRKQMLHEAPSDKYELAHD